MYRAITTIANVYKWGPKTLRKLYLEDDSTEGLYFWEFKAEQYLEAIKKSGGNLNI